MRTPRVYVVDRNPIHRHLIRYRLESGRFAITEAFPSATECLYRIRHHEPPNFIITTYFSDDNDGFRFLRSVLAEAPGCRILFFDSFHDPHLPARLIEEGAADFVAKTPDPDAGIAEVMKNLHFLIREETLAGRS